MHIPGKGWQVQRITAHPTLHIMLAMSTAGVRMRPVRGKLYFPQSLHLHQNPFHSIYKKNQPTGVPIFFIVPKELKIFEKYEW